MACIDPTHVEHQTSPGPAGGTPAEAQARAAATPDVATCADTIGRRPEAVAQSSPATEQTHPLTPRPVSLQLPSQRSASPMTLPIFCWFPPCVFEM